MNPEIQKAIEAFPLRQWVAERFKTRSLNKVKIRVTCPHCGKDALSINTATCTCHCFACDDGGYGGSTWSGKGSLADLIALTDRVPKSEAWRIILERSPYGALNKPEQPTAPTRPDRLLPDEAIPLSKASADHPAVSRLAARGLMHLLPHLHVCVRGRYAYRWIIPCSRFGELEGFEAKAFAKQKPKSLFPEWFATSTTFYTTLNWDWSSDFLVITESSFDAETLGCNAIGLYGSVLHPAQVSLLLDLKKKGLRRLVWFLDWDAWKKEANAILRWTGNLFNNFVVRKPKDSDPNELGRDTCWKLVSEAQYVDSASGILTKLLL